MKTRLAISVWDDRVATTLDFAETLLVVETENGREISRKSVQIGERTVEGRARKIRDLAVEVVLCGAISQPLAGALHRAGIEVIPYVSGAVDEVIAAFLCGRLAEPRFRQPGSRAGARRRWRHGSAFHGGNRQWQQPTKKEV
jgi:predicted Fe-Mo cluster-binding NifX family protein